MAKARLDETPLMRQYAQIKQKYPGAILLFRVGDFYETFGEDAETTARVLGITLTKRGSGSASETPLAGFPFHALDQYLHKLVKAGLRVAICDQLEDPKMTKTIVKRGVTDVVSPGIALGDQMLDRGNNNYLAVLHFPSPQRVGAAFADLSTGDFFCLTGTPERLDKLLYALRPAEVVLPRKDYQAFKERYAEEFYSFRQDDWVFESDYSLQQLLEHFKVHSLKGFGLEDEVAGTVAAGALLHYLRQNEQKHLGHLARLYRFNEAEFLQLDKATVRNLELVQPMHPDGSSLMQLLDCCASPMGSRTLRRWLLFPLQDVAAIEQRQAAVHTYLENNELAEATQQALKSVGDLERLASRLAAYKSSPRDLLALRHGLDQLNQLLEVLGLAGQAALEPWLLRRADVRQAVLLIAASIHPEAPANLNNPGVMAEGISPQLDELRHIQANAKQLVKDLQQREAHRTGITSLKVSYNRAFGYYIEISNANQHKVPGDYIRKQTLTGAERYITPELKELETKILTAEEQSMSLEQQLFQDILSRLQPFVGAMLTNAALAGELDVLWAFAHNARQRRYTRPAMGVPGRLHLLQGRHPVIEAQLPADKPYIPNDLTLDTANTQIILLTGPNMAGKSALLRQTALIVLLAHIGSYVPAQKAEVGLVDRIFTRVGASDNLAAGESTFMVEMTETANILNNASPASLILLDEVGRGTSTYDGLAIAWALTEHLHQRPECAAMTLFATHYHELAALADELPRLHNYHLAIAETEGKVVFLRRLVAGSVARSFGIHVAEMAGMPPSVVRRAQGLLQSFERQSGAGGKVQIEVRQGGDIGVQLSLFDSQTELAKRLHQLLEPIDINRITPVEALLKLQELRHLAAEYPLPKK